MNEPRRLLNDDDATDFERALLRSARHDGPSPALRDKTFLALGLGVGVVGLGATTATTATATTATATSGAAATATAAATKQAAWAGSAAILKWIGFGVVGGALTVTAVIVAPSLGAPNARPTEGTVEAAATYAKTADEVAAGRSSRPGEAPQIATDSEQAAKDALAAPAPTPVEVKDANDARDPKVTNVAPAAPGAVEAGARAEAARRRGSAGAPRSTLTEEIALLDRAREAIARGSASSALAALDEHDRSFPGAALGPEATVLRVEALSLRGDRAAAARLGRAFLAAHPESPHASRLRSILGASAAP